jgi:hypothetical protein
MFDIKNLVVRSLIKFAANRKKGIKFYNVSENYVVYSDQCF